MLFAYRKGVNETGSVSGNSAEYLTSCGRSDARAGADHDNTVDTDRHRNPWTAGNDGHLRCRTSTSPRWRVSCPAIMPTGDERQE
jgi:hypothetical protein